MTRFIQALIHRQILRDSVLRMASLLVAGALGCAGRAAGEASDAGLPVGLFRNLHAGKPQTVVTYGTSLTHVSEWPKALKAYFEKNHPGQVTCLERAKSGQQSNWGVANLKKQVLAHHPDLVFIEFSMNDAATKHQITVEKAEANLDTMVQALRKQNPQVEIVLMTMNVCWDAPNAEGKKPASDRPHLEDYYESYRRYARAHQLCLIDHHPAWKKLQQENGELFRKWLPDGTHPIPEGSLAITWKNIESVLERAKAAAQPASPGPQP